MKILYICNEYPPFLHGGIGTFTRDIAEGLTNRGHEITVWGLYNVLDNKVIEDINGVNVVRMPYVSISSRFNNLWFVINLNRKLRSFLRLNRFDLVECQEWHGLLPFGLKVKYIIRLHGAAVFFDKLLNRPGNRQIHFLEKQTIKKGRNIVAVSEFCGKETMRILGLNKPYKVIYNAVDTKRIAAFSSKKLNKYSIVFANSILPKKGIFELADAFNEVTKSFPNSTLILIGKLGYQDAGENVKDLVLKHIYPEFRDHVHMPGWLNSREDVFNLLAEAHVCCYPSHMEGFGIAPVEAMALGKAVIYMKDGPGPEIIEDRISGFLVDSRNPSAIADKIIEIFSGKYDLDVIGANAIERTFHLFDRDAVFIPNNLEYYRSILS